MCLFEKVSQPRLALNASFFCPISQMEYSVCRCVFLCQLLPLVISSVLGELKSSLAQACIIATFEGSVGKPPLPGLAAIAQKSGSGSPFNIK